MFRSRTSIALLALLPAASCGTGIIGGIIAGSRGGGSGGRPPPVQQPQVVVEPSSVPFFLQAQTLVTVRILNFVLAGDVFVELHSDELGKTTTRQRGLLPSVQGTATRFFYDITNSVGELRVALGVGIPDRNLVVDLVVHANGKTVGKPVKLTLNRPPVVIAQLSNENNGAMTASVDGTSTFRLKARHMTATTAEAASVGVEVLQRNYLFPREKRVGNRVVPNPDGVRRARVPNTSYTRDAAGVSLVSGIVPPTRFPGTAKLLLTDPRAGLTLGKGTAFQPDLPTILYTPELLGVSPSTVTLLGGTLSSLRGSGLLPARHELDEAFTFLFGDITLTVRKGGSSFVVSRQAVLEDESNELQIRFHMPPSPDGLPGPATLELEQRLGDSEPRRFVVRRSLAGDGVRYRVDQPVLGPLVSILPERGFGLASGRFRQGAAVGDDLVLLGGTAGFAKITLLRANALGVYRQAGDTVRAERVLSPHGVLAGDFAAVGRRDLFLTGGSRFGADSTGTHALLRATKGANSIQAPFAVQAQRFFTPSRIIDQAAGDFDGDGKLDVVILPVPDDEARPPQLWLGVGGPSPVPRPIGPADDVRGAAVHVADLDGDGDLDVAIAGSAPPWNVFVYWGDGAGGFRGRQVLSYDTTGGKLIRGGLVDIVSYAAGPKVPHRNLCIVAGVLEGIKRRPILVSLLFDPSKRRFAAASARNALVYDSGVTAFTVATAMDIFGDPGEELVAATLDTTTFPVQAFLLGQGAPLPLQGFILSDPGMLGISAIRPAVLWEGRGGRSSVRGLVVLHEELIDNKKTAVLSALPRTKKGLGTRFPGLVQGFEPDALAVGDFDGDGSPGDCAANDNGKITLHFAAAPAIYDVAPARTVDPRSFVPRTMASCPWSGKGDLLCWLTRKGRLGVLFPGTQAPFFVAKDLRDYLPAKLRGSDLGDGSRILSCNPNGDAAGDLAVFVEPAVPTKGPRGALVFLRGASNQGPGRNPFLLPDAGLVVAGDAHDPATGNMLGHSPSNRPGVEVVLAFRDRLRVATLDLGAQKEDRFRFDPGLPVDDIRLPVGLTARWPILDDLDGDGKDDLAFLITTERRLRLFVNRLRHVGNGKFTGRLVSIIGPTLVYLGDAFGLAAADMDGDGLRDLFVAATIERLNVREPSPCLFRNEGRATFSACFTYPRFFLGPGDRKAFAIFDMDLNGLDDLILGTRVLLSR